MSKRSIFIPMIGQYENIGDIILRRPLLEWSRCHGDLHVYLGNCPQGYQNALGLRAGDVVYHSFARWFLQAFLSAVRGNGHYVFKPGEIQLTVSGLKEHLAVLPFAVLMRMRGGKVIRVGAGARNFAPLPRLMMWPSLAISHYIAWRDERTARYMRIGDTMPDLAFSGGDDADAFGDAAQRDCLVLSMRGDKDQRMELWIDAIYDYAKRTGLEIWVVTQVLRDRDLSIRLARRLGGRHLDWHGDEHNLQEDRLKQIYRRARLVVSDRLHSLIMGYSLGAIPVGLLTYPSDKIDRHFDTIGVPRASVYVEDRDSTDLGREIDARLTARCFYFKALISAREQINRVRLRFEELLS